MTNELQKRLGRLYGNRKKRDFFGKRLATPRQIQEALTEDEFKILESFHQPTDEDIKTKGDD